MPDLNNIIINAALEALKESNGAAVILFLDAVGDWEIWKGVPDKKKLILVTQDGPAVEALKPFEKELCAAVKLPPVKLTRMGQIKLSIITCITEGAVKNSDTVVCVSGLSGSGVLDEMVVLDLSKETEIITARGATQGFLKKVRPEVLEAVLNLSLELASEGREAKPLGATFVIGDYAKVSELSRPLIMNPFKGYPEDARNILDEAVHETIKEFALLDGAFLVREDGVVMNAGVHLDAALEDEGHHLPGLGCRHMAAAGITDVTDAAAITISGSTGAVRVFKEGRIILEIERPGQGARERR